MEEEDDELAKFSHWCDTAWVAIITPPGRTVGSANDAAFQSREVRRHLPIRRGRTVLVKMSTVPARSQHAGQH